MNKCISNKFIIGESNNANIVIDNNTRKQNIALIGPLHSGKLSMSFIPMIKQDIKNNNNPLLLISDNEEILDITHSFANNYKKQITIIDIQKTILMYCSKEVNGKLYYRDELYFSKNKQKVYYQLEKSIKNNNYIFIKLSKNNYQNERSLYFIFEYINTILIENKNTCLDIFFDNLSLFIGTNSLEMVKNLINNNSNNLTLTITMTDLNLNDIINSNNISYEYNIKLFLYEYISNFFFYSVIERQYKQDIEQLLKDKINYIFENKIIDFYFIKNNYKTFDSIINSVHNDIEQASYDEYYAYIYNIKLNEYKMYKLNPNYID